MTSIKTLYFALPWISRRRSTANSDEAAGRRGCSARELILRSIERLVEEELPDSGHHVQLPLVPATGRRIRPVTNDEALFS